jgi:hypothetical protein
MRGIRGTRRRLGMRLGGLRLDWRGVPDCAQFATRGEEFANDYAEFID